MRNLTESEKLSLRELLQMETNALVKAEASKALITDEALKKAADAGLLAMEGRIKGIQQFINENSVINTGEVR
jgi:hypothetical protein